MSTALLSFFGDAAQNAILVAGNRYAPLAQWIEHWLAEPGVERSSRSRGTTLLDMEQHLETAETLCGKDSYLGPRSVAKLARHSSVKAGCIKR